MFVIMLILWTIISIVVMIGYRFFSGGGALPPQSVDILIGAPIAIIVFLAFAKKQLLTKAPQQIHWWITKFTKAMRFLAVWLLLPIFVNAISIGIKFLGFAKYANYLYDVRYHSLWLSATLVVVTISLYHLRKPAR